MEFENQEVIRDYYNSEQKAVSDIFAKVFGWMFIGLLVTAITAFFTVSSPTILATILTNNFYWIGLLIAEVVLVIVLTARIHKMSKTTAMISFLLYSFINGLTLSTIFLIYTLSSIYSVFFITAGMFGVMALYGYTTKKDLSKLGPILLMALIGIILASIVNIFWLNDTFSFIVAVIGVIVFVGLTAYDVQKIKVMAGSLDNSDDFATKFAIIGALTLYLDFINLFIKLLSILGKNRD